MKVLSGIIVTGLLFAAVPAMADDPPAKHEIGLTLGGLLGGERTGGATRLDLGSGVALQANYGYRLLSGSAAALYGEVHFLANPLRDVTSANQSLTRDVATLYVTPGLRVKFLPGHALAPYVAAGAGWSLYEQSTTTLGGNTNAASRLVSHGAFDYGAGVDCKFWRFIGLRAEVRDFFTGQPAYNSASFHGGQHNVVVGGGLVLKFH